MRGQTGILYSRQSWNTRSRFPRGKTHLATADMIHP